MSAINDEEIIGQLVLTNGFVANIIDMSGVGAPNEDNGEDY